MNVNASLKRVSALFLVFLLFCGLAACGGRVPAAPQDGVDIAGQDFSYSIDPESLASDGEADAVALDYAALESGEDCLYDASEDGQFAANLVALEIETIGDGSNAVVASLDTLTAFSFDHTSSSEYVLTLKGASLVDATYMTPILAEAGSGKVRSVRAVQQDEDVLVRILASPEALLQANTNGSRIVVAAESSDALASSLDLHDVRAQAAPPAEAEEGEVAEIEELLPDEALLEEAFGFGTQYTGRLISLDLQDTDIDNALRIIAEVSNLNIIASDDVTGKVTLRLIDVPWDQALDVILKTNGLDKVQEGNVIRIAPIEKLRAERQLLTQLEQASEQLAPLKVQYIRISYARAAEMQPLVETVLTERGTVAFDERTNQLIVKDIDRGLVNVAALVEKLDLRTPQVLIETQIVEANRKFVRELGSELGFFYVRGPETGNALPYNFPNSMSVGGSATNSQGDPAGDAVASYFPAGNASSALSMLFGSADGTRGLNLRLSQAENEGRVRIISRPSVAVTNNTPAVIRSVEKIRIKIPQGGVSVATGSGATAAGAGGSATEVVEVGIVLNVTAQASPDYYVLLDIDAKSSALGARERGVDEIPPEIERSATSSVLVSSGQTFALGGIYRITEDNNISGTPFFKDVPVLGQFFRRSELADSDEELIFFITPRIIEGSFDDAAMREVS